MTRQNQELEITLPYNREVMFSNYKDVYKKGTEKRQTKLLRKLGFLQPFLAEDEEILLITTGCSPITLLEQLLGGWTVMYLKRALFVFTTQRIFHIPTTSNFSYRNSIAHIYDADCASIQLKWGKLVVEYRNGEKEKFIGIASQERKKIQALLQNTTFGAYHANARRRVHLCPRCTNELEPEVYRCAHCQLEFKDKKTARKISILYPGGGYFYTRHPWLGIVDAITETLLIVFVIIALGMASRNPETIVVVIVYGVALFLEKLVTVYHSNHFVKEYIPKEKDIPPLP